MLQAVEHANVVELSVALRHEVGIKQLLQDLVARLKPSYPRASVSLFLKDDGCVLYTVDPFGNHTGRSARTFDEATKMANDALLRRPFTIDQIKQTLGVAH